jgi:hypothetical protein
MKGVDATDTQGEKLGIGEIQALAGLVEGWKQAECRFEKGVADEAVHWCDESILSLTL